MKRFLTLLLLIHSLSSLSAQATKQLTASEIYDRIQKLSVLGSVLYVAAHPDDENTRLISYLANELKVDVTYLSLTRGDGGQNLIGPEIAELLGVIRTQELLAARRVDGGNQMFSRANDFGFSKHSDETMRIWNKDEVLSDVVWAIRKLQPDIVINRFDHNSAGKTHGHHTASAILGLEAFELAGKTSAFPEQLKFYKRWQPKRIYFNTSWWMYGSQEAFEKADKSQMTAIDVGVFYPMKGKSNNEISAESRSLHRCQGMGSIGVRGSQIEYLEFLKGEKPANMSNLFDGIDLTWNKIKGGWQVRKSLETLEKNFKFSAPWESLSELMEIRRLMNSLPDDRWRDKKQAELDEIIKACLGIFAEAIASGPSATPGEMVDLKLEIILRGRADITLKSVEFLPLRQDTAFGNLLTYNKPLNFSKKIQLPDNLPFTNAYWLNEPWQLGMFRVDDQQLRGLPETPRTLKVRWNLLARGQDLSFETDVMFKKEVSERGEVYQPFEVMPPVFTNITEKAYVFAGDGSKHVRVKIKAGRSNLKGFVSLDLPQGWRSEPSKIDFELAQKSAEKTVSFDLFPPKNESEGVLRAIATVDGKTYDKEIITIQYEHIPTQTVLRTGESKIVKIDLKTAGTRIGYLKGAGDEIPASLQQIGYSVTMLDDTELNWENLRSYDVVILGVRALNTKERLQFEMPGLFEYVKNGGTVIVQYNTNFELVTKDIAPFPLKLSRDRVTVEDAEVRFLTPEHPVLNSPNKITAKDFDGWVQERGLYFPSEWGKEFEAILSCNDPGETPKDGGLLVGKHGDGYFIYTGYSWFRQLPAGVPGAFRLFANMISIGKEPKP